RFGERFRNLILQKSHIVSGVSAHDLGRDHRNRGDLVRGETLNTNAGVRGGLLPALGNPSRSSLAGRDDDFLSRRTQRHLAAKLHNGRRVTGLLKVVLGLSGLNEPAKGASGSRLSLCHYFS